MRPRPRPAETDASSQAALDAHRADDAAIAAAHVAAIDAGQPGYTDPSSGLFVLTAAYLRERGSCCANACRHCPYGTHATGGRAQQR